MSRRDFHRPHLLSVFLGKRPNELVAAPIAHPVDASRGHGRRAVAATQALDLPCERGTSLWPLLEQTGFFGMSSALRPLPLRPIKLTGYSILREGSERQDNLTDSKCERGNPAFDRYHDSRISRSKILSLAGRVNLLA